MVEVNIIPSGEIQKVKRGDTIEVIGFEGLKERLRRSDYHGMYSVLAATAPSFNTGMFWEQPPPATEEAIQDVRELFFDLKERAAIEINLPEGWDVRRTGTGRLYFVDHRNKTTSWTPPAETSS